MRKEISEMLNSGWIDQCLKNDQIVSTKETQVVWYEWKGNIIFVMVTPSTS